MGKLWSLLGRYILPILRHHARVWGRMTDLFSKCPRNMSNSQCLHEWVEKFLPDSVSTSEKLLLQPLNGDAGFRHYFRLNTCPPLIAVSAPPEHENNPSFVSVALLLRQNGIHTPMIYAVDYQQGFLLLEDLGDELLLPQLSADTVDVYYAAAETALLSMQKVSVPSGTLPAFDRQRLLDEMNLFPEWFLVKLLGINLQSADYELIHDVMNQLVENALGQPQVFVHRDFHSRNLMLLGGGENDEDSEIGVLDFQDAVTGPITYDLVSLLRDCYIRWPGDYVSQRALSYYHRAVAVEIAPPVSDKQILRWFDLMGLQRHIKVLGIFSRLYLRDGKPGYLNDLPLVIRYTLEQLEPYPEFDKFKDWLALRVLPELPKQDWFFPWETAGDI